jgi:hypothetical protein
MSLSKPSHAGTLQVVSSLLVGLVGLAGLAGGCGRRTAEVPTPTSVTAYRIEWISANAPPTLKTGEKKDIEVSFRNAGTQAISNEMLAVSYHWMDASDPTRVIVWDGLRAAIRHPLQPGERYVATLPLQPPDRPGNYILSVDLVREGVAWFSQKGWAPSASPVTVQ